MFYITRVLPFLIRRLEHVVAVIKSSKRDILEYAHVLEDRVTVISLAADPNLYMPRDKVHALTSIGSQYGITQPYVLFISRIEHPGKNHVCLIIAFDQLKLQENTPHQLVLAGNDRDRADEVHQVAEKAS